MTALVRTPSAIAPAALALAAGAAVAALSVAPERVAAATAVAIVLAAAAAWALARLQSFVLIAVLGAMVLPLSLAQPAGAQVAAADVLLVLALAAWLVRRAVGVEPAPWIAGNPLFVPTALFAGVTAASVAWSVAPAETIKATVQIVEIVIVIPLVFATLPRSIGMVRRGLLAFVAVTCVLALVTLAYFAPRLAAGDVSAQYLPGLHKNAIGSFLGGGLVLAYAFWLCEARPRLRRVLAIAALVQLAGMFAAASRGALAGALLGILAVSLLLRRRRLLTIGAAAAAAVVFGVAFNPELSLQERASGGYESSWVRGYSFENAVDRIAERPLLGTGAGTYRDEIPELGIGLRDPNNMFLLTAAELGIGGIVALLFVLLRFGRLFLAARHLAAPAAVPAVAAGAVALSLLVHFQIDSTWTRGSASLAFAAIGLLLAAGRLAPRRGRHAEGGAGGVPPPVSAGAAAVTAPQARAGAAEPTPPAVDTAQTVPVRQAKAGAAEPAPPAATPQPVPAARVANPGSPPAEPPLRVLHVITSDAYAGIERHAVRLARELRAAGCAAELACPPSAARVRAEAAALGIPVRPPAGGGRGPWLGRVARRLAAAPPDILHLHDGRAALAGSVLARLGQPVVVRTQHFTHPASAGRRGLRGDASLALHRALNRRLDGYVAVSRSVAEAACERREITDAAVVVIPPGIDPPDDAAVLRAQAARERLPQPAVAFVGRLEAEKRVDVLLQAIPAVLAQLPGCRFVIAGSGGQEGALQLLARRLGIEAAITWPGAVADPGAVLEAAHVYVNPSPAEGFGLATIEAMAFALPAVAADSGGSAEIVEDGVTGLLFPGGEVEALAAAIVRLAGDRSAAAQIGEEARRRTVSRYGIDRTAQATLAFYRRLSD